MIEYALVFALLLVGIGLLALCAKVSELMLSNFYEVEETPYDR